ncbi:MAG TPA: hypothetical protein VNO33_18825, partial [Kofleriaceae bacterium]|nr:hypothetical protein [Kofleriaceae bacterium]
VAFMFGSETDDVRLSADDLFVRREVSINGEEDVIAIDLCRVDGDGVLTGEIASCYGDECVVGAIAAHPVVPIDEPEAENMTVVSEWSGSPEWDTGEVTINVRHHGDLAYVVRSADGLRIVDLTDPAQPVDLGHLPPRFPADEYYNDVKIHEAGGRIYAFLASSLRGVVAADVTDPSAPVEVGTFPAAPIGGGEVRVHTLFIEGDRLYAATTSLGALQIFDIAAPAEGFAQLGQFVHPDVGTFGGFVHDLSVQDGIAYLNYWNLGFVAVDAGKDPSAPAVVGAFADYPRRTSHSNWVTEVGGRRIAVHGDEDFDAHVRIVDVDPESATAFEEIGSYQTRAPVSVHNIMAVGELALVTYYQDGLRVLDLADPTSPVEVAHFASWPGAEPGYGRSFYEGAIGVDHDPERDLILLADTHRGLIVLTLDR